MKVIRITDEDTKLTKKQRQQVAILKLTDNGKYVENVGIKDNDFYLLVEGEEDDMYLEFRALGKRPWGNRNFSKADTEAIVKMVLIMNTEDQINKQKAKLEGKEWEKW